MYLDLLATVRSKPIARAQQSRAGFSRCACRTEELPDDMLLTDLVTRLVLPTQSRLGPRQATRLYKTFHRIAFDNVAQSSALSMVNASQYLGWTLKRTQRVLPFIRVRSLYHAGGHHSHVGGSTGRPRKVSDATLVEQLRLHSWSGSWSTRHDAPKRFLLGTTTYIARTIDMPARTLRRRLQRGRMNFYHAKRRHGL
jgi:hypothetical protein